MNTLEQLFENIVAVGGEAIFPKAELLGELHRNLLDGNAASELSRAFPSHAIADCKNEVALFQRRLARLAQITNTLFVQAVAPGIDLRCSDGICRDGWSPTKRT